MDQFELDGIIETIRRLPDPIPGILTWIVVLSVIAPGLSLLGKLVSQLPGTWERFVRPIFFNADEKRRVRRRKKFAAHIEGQIRRLNDKEQWTDERYAELEAEVEAEGRSGSWRHYIFFGAQRRQVRREPSVASALKRSSERLVLVEGDPGSGKTVALRHLALTLIERVRRDRGGRAPIPLYLNLRDLNRGPGEAIDSELLRRFVLAAMNRANTREVDRFLVDEFDRGLADGTWIFLFDSFDEIPEVVASNDAEASIRLYADAIHDFLHGMNGCRGIVSSRGFPPVAAFGWPRFRLLPLSDRRIRRLVKLMDLPLTSEQKVLGELGLLDSTTANFARNPLFLALICDFVRDRGVFPRTVHEIFATYIRTRWQLDQDQLRSRYRLDAAEMQRLTAAVAFTMAFSKGVGLSPPREVLVTATCETLKTDCRSDVESILDALEYSKLATTNPDSRQFSFVHRRFQEYFATCYILRHPDAVSTTTLLTDSRWRESTIAMLQLHQPDDVQPLLDRATEILTAAVADLAADRKKSTSARALHVIDVLQGGGTPRVGAPSPPRLQKAVDSLLSSAFQEGAIYEKKWVLDVVGAASRDVRVDLLQRAFLTESAWLREVALRKIRSVGNLAAQLVSDVRRAIVHMAATGKLATEKYTLITLTEGLGRKAEFRRVIKLLLAAPWVDRTVHALAASIIIAYEAASGAPLGDMAAVPFFAVVAHGTFYPIRETAFFAWRLQPSMWSLPIRIFEWPLETARHQTRHASLFVRGYWFITLRWFFAAAGFGTVAAHDPVVAWGGVALYLYFAAWPLSVLIMARSTRRVSAAAWLLAPLAGPQLAASSVARYIKGALSSPHRRRWALAVAGATALLTTLTLLLVWLWSYAWVRLLGQILLGSWFVATIARAAINRAGDLRKLRDLKEERTAILPGYFLELIDEMDTRAGVISLLEAVRQRVPLASSPEATDVLIDLSQFLTSATRPTVASLEQQMIHAHQLDELPYRSVEFRQWIKKDPVQKYRKARLIAEDGLDEIGRLTERLLQSHPQSAA